MPERFKSVVCVDIIIKKIVNNKTSILLMKRKNTGSHDGEYDLPGGHLEKEEDLFSAMMRETKEELLIDLKREEISLIYLLHHYSGERLNFIFETNGEELKPQIGEPDKCSELRWVDLADLPEETTPKVKLIISDILEGKKYNKL